MPQEMEDSQSEKKGRKNSLEQQLEKEDKV
jgi:hypothetical protein